MKKIMLLLISLMVAHTLMAQKYYPQPALHKFEGIWKYADSGQTFKIKLSVEKIYMKYFNTKIDELEGQYIYEKDNKIIVNTLDSLNFFISAGIFSNREKSLNRIRFVFVDGSTRNVAAGFLKLIPGKDELLWTLINYQDQINNHRGISVPKKIILHRVKE